MKFKFFLTYLYMLVYDICIHKTIYIYIHVFVGHHLYTHSMKTVDPAKEKHGVRERFAKENFFSREWPFADKGI